MLIRLLLNRDYVVTYVVRVLGKSPSIWILRVTLLSKVTPNSVCLVVACFQSL
jgi:hypothetical protein